MRGVRAQVVMGSAALAMLSQRFRASSPWHRSPPLPLVPLILDHNVRNTRQTANAFQPLVEHPTRFLGGEGPAVKFVACGVVARLPKSRQLGEPIGPHAKNFCMSDRHESASRRCRR